MEVIKSIEEITTPISDDGRWEDVYEGYCIKTTEQEILIAIENHQDCCERWGYFTSEDHPRAFEGAKLLGVDLVDEAYNTKVFDAFGEFYEGNCVFVNVRTSLGTLQFVAYNEHNGYYGHNVVVLSKSLNFKKRI